MPFNFCVNSKIRSIPTPSIPNFKNNNNNICINV